MWSTERLLWGVELSGVATVGTVGTYRWSDCVWGVKTKGLAVGINPELLVQHTTMSTVCVVVQRWPSPSCWCVHKDLTELQERQGRVIGSLFIQGQWHEKVEFIEGSETWLALRKHDQYLNFTAPMYRQYEHGECDASYER